MAGREHVRTLEKRRTYLEAQIEAEYGSVGSLGYARGEAAALRWALPILAELVESEADKARNVHRQRAAAEVVNCAARAILYVLATGDRDAYDRLMDDAPPSVVNVVERRRFGTNVPQAAPVD